MEVIFKHWLSPACVMDVELCDIIIISCALSLEKHFVCENIVCLLPLKKYFPI